MIGLSSPWPYPEMAAVNQLRQTDAELAATSRQFEAGKGESDHVHHRRHRRNCRGRDLGCRYWSLTTGREARVAAPPALLKGR
jgi:hypothetical protein